MLVRKLLRDVRWPLAVACLLVFLFSLLWVRVAAVSKAARGKTHDKTVDDRSRLQMPEGVCGTGDGGYRGTDLEVPHREPRGGTLTRRQRVGDRRLSERRIAVEHGIVKVKICRVVADRSRNPLRKHTLVMKNVADLHNRMLGEWSACTTRRSL